MTFLRSPFAFWTSTTSTTRASSSGFSIKFHAILLASFISTIYGFTFRFTTPPTQCESLKAIWEGGTPPYKLLLVPVDFMPEGTETRIIFERTISTGNELTFTFPFPARTRFAAIMSDATGFGTGGTSPLINIRSSNSSSCLPTSPSKPNFYFYLSPSTLTQCSPVHISWDSSPSSPVTVYGVIPQGQSFNLNADSRASGGRGFDWTVNVRSGTQMFFVVGDSSGSGKGGSSDVTTVRSGSSSRCIDATSPSSTEDAGVGGTAPLPGSTQTGGGSGSNGSSSVSGSSPSGSSPSNGSGSGSGNGSGGNGNGDGGGTGNGGSGGGGTSNGSGGGTVQGPLDPSSGANGANADSSRSSKLGLILGLVLGLSGLGIVLGLCFVFYKRRQREKKRRDNQRARLLASSD
ncbi:hypothetical protein FRC15_010259, partial [Serendipita sp. 397]